MIQLVLVLVIACALLAVVVLLARGGLGGPERLADSRNKPGADISSLLQVQLPSRALMEQIFADEDLRFVTAAGTRQIRREFIRERRRLALLWLTQIRRQATGILRFHLRAVRSDLSLRPSVEFQIVFHAVLFFAIYSLLWFLVTCYGAFWARSVMRNALALAGRLSGLGGNILAEAGRSRLRMAES